MKNKKIVGLMLVVSIMLGALVMALPEKAKAASDTSIVIQPSQVEITGKPGDKVKKSTLIINRSNSLAKLKVYSKDFKAVDENGKIELYDRQDDPAFSAQNWLIPQYLQISIPPLQSKTVDFIAIVPDNMPAGGNYGAVVFENSDGVNSENFGTLVLLTVMKEGITTGGKISGISSFKFQDKDPVGLSLTLKNLSNTHLTASGEISVTDWRGQKVEQFNSGNLIVYPGLSMLYKFEWQKHPAFWFYRFNVSLENSLQPDQKFNASTWFVVLPGSLPLITSAVVLILLAAGLYLFRKKISLQGFKKRLNPSVLRRARI